VLFSVSEVLGRSVNSKKPIASFAQIYAIRVKSDLKPEANPDSSHGRTEAVATAAAGLSGVSRGSTAPQTVIHSATGRRVERMDDRVSRQH